MAGKKVLVVDDEKLIVKGIRFSLEQDNMEVDCAYDGEEALDMIYAEMYDLIVLDLGLPDLDGTEIIRRVRSWAKTPIIVISGGSPSCM